MFSDTSVLKAVSREKSFNVAFVQLEMLGNVCSALRKRAVRLVIARDTFLTLGLFPWNA